MKKFNVIKEIQELRNQLSYSKNIGFFFGAGTSTALGIPNISELTRSIEKSITGDILKSFQIIKKDLETTLPDRKINIEDILNQTRRIRDITGEKEEKKYIWGKIIEEECRQSDFSKYLPDISVSVSGENSSQLTISVDASAPYEVDKVKVYVDDKEIASSGSKDFSVKYSLSIAENNSTLKIKAKITDKNGNEDSDSKDMGVSF